jgi:cytochrome c oxidase subunit IV
MGHLTYDASKKVATKTILILAAITIFEVMMALLGKGYIVKGFHLPIFLIGSLMIIMSVVKAYLIIFEFMHMKYEVPGLVRTVLLPTVLLIWAVIAFLYEGRYWNTSRNEVMNPVKTESVSTQTHTDK